MCLPACLVLLFSLFDFPHRPLSQVSLFLDRCELIKFTWLSHVHRPVFLSVTSCCNALLCASSSRCVVERCDKLIETEGKLFRKRGNGSDDDGNGGMGNNGEGVGADVMAMGVTWVNG